MSARDCGRLLVFGALCLIDLGLALHSQIPTLSHPRQTIRPSSGGSPCCVVSARLSVAASSPASPGLSHRRCFPVFLRPRLSACSCGLSICVCVCACCIPLFHFFTAFLVRVLNCDALTVCQLCAFFAAMLLINRDCVGVSFQDRVVKCVG